MTDETVNHSDDTELPNTTQAPEIDQIVNDANGGVEDISLDDVVPVEGDITLPVTSIPLDFTAPTTPQDTGVFDDDVIEYTDPNVDELPSSPIAYNEGQQNPQLLPPKKTPTPQDLAQLTMSIPNDSYTLVQLERSENEFERELVKLVKEKKLSASEAVSLRDGYKASVGSAQTFVYPDGDFDALTSREGSDWKREVTTGEGRITMSHPPIKLDDGGDRLEGLAAIQYIFKKSGLGAPVHVPFFQSGVRLYIDVFPEITLLNLSRALSAKRIELGRETHGATWTADDVIINATICEAILDNVIASSVALAPKTDLTDYLTALDIPILQTAALAAIYPNGYPAYHHCINTAKGTCDYTLNPKRKAWSDFEPDSLLNYVNCFHVDLSYLPSSAIMHMSSRPKGQYNDAQMVAYRETMKQHLAQHAKSFTHSLGDDTLVFHFKVPTMKEYFKRGREWVNKLEKTVTDILATESFADDEVRENRRYEVMESYRRVLEVLKHTAWVDYIELVPSNGGKSRIMSTPDTIDGVLNVVWQQDDFTERFEEAVAKFKVDMTVSFIGINNFVCPKCKSGQTEPDAKYPSIIPINVTSHFFTLMELRSLYRQLTQA